MSLTTLVNPSPSRRDRRSGASGRREAGVLLHAVYVTRSGPMSGRADMEAAFRTRAEAVAFLTNLHGLDLDEQKRLSRDGQLALNPRWHGSESCAFHQESLSSEDAKSALSGERFL